MERKRLTRQESQLVTHAMLVDAAEVVFLREGFEHASVEQITEAAGFSRGAFYSNFNDKDDLALAVIDERRRDVAEALGQMMSIVLCNPLIRRAAEMDRQLLFFATIEKLPDISREPSDGG